MRFLIGREDREVGEGLKKSRQSSVDSSQQENDADEIRAESRKGGEFKEQLEERRCCGEAVFRWGGPPTRVCGARC